MPCCETCACSGQPFACLVELDPVRYAHLGRYCRNLSDETGRRMVRDRSRGGMPAVVLMAPRVTPEEQTTENRGCGCGRA